MPELLELEGLTTGYGEAVVIRDLSLTLGEGEALALLGRNGVGKTTLIDSVIGVTRRFAGSVRLAGVDLTAASPEKRAAAGIGWVPQERDIFRSLTVEENLTATARPGRWTLRGVYEMFPRLGERRANMGDQLSGGEQQMLAIGRALMLNPRILLLDEPTEGLAPIVIEQLLASIRRIIREEGMATIIVEQHAKKILGVTDRAVILDRGAIVHEAPSRALIEDPAPLELHLGVIAKQNQRSPAHAG
ncbi:ABC transporter ATP-binding protein [Amaricoccus solimangrovi]|uniref:ABC transporter ATP-binding protein n=1 Tax=Amaricoccus solimangrovi TaxID=2589815 RepID=A0A501WQQ6_9RHOB|nr:ABC transporter ATP-binding protein [Amaricoccus solimangrovi]TPE51688.1 ABC transporter ATP-binding protein [Amaricoccus solimangrovi]